MFVFNLDEHLSIIEQIGKHFGSPPGSSMFTVRGELIIRHVTLLYHWLGTTVDWGLVTRLYIILIEKCVCVQTNILINKYCIFAMYICTSPIVVANISWPS